MVAATLKATSAKLNNYNAWGIAYVVASSSDKLYTVTCTRYCDQGTSFQIRIPAGAVPSTGSDHHLTVVNGTTEYDMWKAVHNTTNNTWSAGSVHSTSITGWGAECAMGHYCGSSVAAGFAGMGGVVRPEEIQQGHIDHALSLVITSAKSHYIACPGTSSDGGNTGSYSIPEGARLQLDPTFNVAAQSWPAWEKMMARAMQVYGAYVSDQNGVSPMTLTFYGQTDQNRGNVSWSTVGLSDSSPNVLANFPWSRVRVLKIHKDMGSGSCQ